MKYLFKKVWPLVLILIASYVVVLTKIIDGPVYDLAEACVIFAMYVIIVGLLCQPLGKLVKPCYKDTGWFSCHKWENGGKVYDRVFKVSEYKDNVVNAAMIFGGKTGGNDDDSSTVGQKPLISRNPDAIMKIINETCKSELVHWILILISPIMLFLIHSWFKWLLWGMYILANLRDIIIQRYNRPRFVRLYGRLSRQGTE